MHFFIGALLLCAAADPAPPDMAGMAMGGMDMGTNAAGTYLMNLASGTGMNPRSLPMPMFMRRRDAWNLAFMGQAFLVDTQQSGPRGADKLYSTNWGMFSATRDVLSGAFMFQAMLSLEPATVTNRSYPLLFQTGETAYGRPLTDAQHPHDLFMGMGFHYAHAAGRKAMLDLYYAPVGDPALGPVAFPHRASAAELPQAPIGHHWQDSTHISDNVVTAALLYRWVRLEASGFYGTEPDENRWNIDWGPIDSYSARVSVFPAKNWMGQFSAGRLTRPERLSPGDIVRTTASLHYSRPMNHRSAWSTSMVWGRNHEVQSGRDGNSYLAETLYPIAGKLFLTGRAEWVDKDELFANDPAVERQLGISAGSAFRIQAYTAGCTRDIGAFKGAETGIGASVSAYVIPAAIQPFYGGDPVGVNLFLRVRLRPSGQ